MLNVALAKVHMFELKPLTSSSHCADAYYRPAWTQRPMSAVVRFIQILQDNLILSADQELRRPGYHTHLASWDKSPTQYVSIVRESFVDRK